MSTSYASHNTNHIEYENKRKALSDLEEETQEKNKSPRQDASQQTDTDFLMQKVSKYSSDDRNIEFMPEDKLELQPSLDMSHAPWIAAMNMTEQFIMVRPGFKTRVPKISKAYMPEIRSQSDVTNESIIFECIYEAYASLRSVRFVDYNRNVFIKDLINSEREELKSSCNPTQTSTLYPRPRQTAIWLLIKHDVDFDHPYMNVIDAFAHMAASAKDSKAALASSVRMSMAFQDEASEVLTEYYGGNFKDFNFSVRILMVWPSSSNSDMYETSYKDLILSNNATFNPVDVRSNKDKTQQMCESSGVDVKTYLEKLTTLIANIAYTKSRTLPPEFYDMSTDINSNAFNHSIARIGAELHNIVLKPPQIRADDDEGATAKQLILNYSQIIAEQKPFEYVSVCATLRKQLLERSKMPSSLRNHVLVPTRDDVEDPIHDQEELILKNVLQEKHSLSFPGMIIFKAEDEHEIKLHLLGSHKESSTKRWLQPWRLKSDLVPLLQKRGAIALYTKPSLIRIGAMISAWGARKLPIGHQYPELIPIAQTIVAAPTVNFFRDWVVQPCSFTNIFTNSYKPTNPNKTNDINPIIFDYMQISRTLGTLRCTLRKSMVHHQCAPSEWIDTSVQTTSQPGTSSDHTNQASTHTQSDVYNDWFDSMNQNYGNEIDYDDVDSPIHNNVEYTLGDIAKSLVNAYETQSLRPLSSLMSLVTSWMSRYGLHSKVKDILEYEHNNLQTVELAETNDINAYLLNKLGGT